MKNIIKGFSLSMLVAIIFASLAYLASNEHHVGRKLTNEVFTNIDSLKISIENLNETLDKIIEVQKQELEMLRKRNNTRSKELNTKENYYKFDSGVTGDTIEVIILSSDSLAYVKDKWGVPENADPAGRFIYGDTIPVEVITKDTIQYVKYKVAPPIKIIR